MFGYYYYNLVHLAIFLLFYFGVIILTWTLFQLTNVTEIFLFRLKGLHEYIFHFLTNFDRII